MSTLGLRGITLQPSGVAVLNGQGVFVAVSRGFLFVQDSMVSSNEISKLQWFSHVVWSIMLAAFSARFALDLTSVAYFAVRVFRKVC